MNLFSCPRCGAQFDVSSMDPGSTFICGSCENTLTVPAGSAGPKRPAPKPKPSGVGPARGAGRRVDPRRAGGGGAAPAPGRAPAAPSGGRPAAAPRRPSRRPSRERGDGERSNLPLVLGGVGGLVVILVVVLVVALSGGEPGTGGGGEGAGGGDTARNPSGDGTPEETRSKRERLRLALLDARTTAAKRQVFTEAEAAGVDDIARQAALAALAQEPDLAWANRGAGKKDLTPVYDEYTALIESNPDVGTFMNEAGRDLEEMMAEVEWGTPEEFDRAKDLLAQVKEHARKLETDQSYADVQMTKVWVRLHPVYSDYECVVADRSPYVIAVQHHGRDVEKARAIADRNAKILQHLYREFHRIFDPTFDLPELSEREDADERLLKVFTFIDEPSFQKYQQTIGRPLPAGVRAYYFRRDQWISLFEGSGFEKQAAEGESDFNTNKIFHEGTHQLVHTYTKILMERDGGEEVRWEDPKTSSRAHWFQEGFAELVGTSRPRADGLWDLMAPNRNRTAEWARARSGNAPEWSLEELLQVRDSNDMRRKAGFKALTGADALASLFYAQAWSFCHFLWYAEDGKYRPKLLEYFGKELHGDSGYDEWQEVWGKSDDDWSDLEAEWHAWFEKVRGELGSK